MLTLAEETTTQAGEADDLALVGNLMQVLVKAFRTVHLYPRNNPIYRMAIDEVRAAFAPVWNRTAELELQVTDGKLLWHGEVVLSEATEGDSISWVLFKDGIRSLVLSAGVEDGDIEELLHVMQTAQSLPAEASDDLLTLLWDADLHCVRYTCIEPDDNEIRPIEADWGWIHGHGPDANAVRQQVAADTGAVAGIVRPDDFQSTLYFLDAHDIESLKQQIQNEYEQDLRSNVLAKLFDLLELESYVGTRSENIAIVRDFIPHLLALGEVQSVVYILDQSKSLLRRELPWEPQHRTALDELPATLSDPEVVTQLLQVLDDGVADPSDADLDALFAELNSTALPTVLEWFAKARSERVRGKVQRAAEQLAKRAPDRLMRLLESDDESVAIAAAQVAGWSKLSACIAGLGKLLSHPSRRVSLRAAKSLAFMGGASAMRELERAVRHQDREVRLAAVNAIAQRKHRGALSVIKAELDNRAHRTDMTERRAFYEAYAVLAGSSAIPLLSTKLRGGWLMRAADPLTRACAAIALGRVRDPEARDVLARAQHERHPLVRNAIHAAMGLA